MALVFPPNPVDGQLYPNPPEPGVQQYIFNATKGTWLTIVKGLAGIKAEEPIFLSGPEQDPTINIRPATTTESGYLSAIDKRKLDSVPETVGSVTEVTAGVGLGAPGTGDSVTTTGTINLLPANNARIGGVVPGVGLQVSPEGRMDIKPPASLAIGGVKQGNGINIATDGTISVAQGFSYVALDTLTPKFNGTTTGFTLTVNSVPYSPFNTNSLLIFVGGVIQVPGSSFTVAGSTITFSGAPPTNSSFYGVALT
jgi:hypothetical protein